MNRLHIYTVHLKPHDPAPHETAEFIKEGFSLWAFLFTWMWALYHRMWWIAVGFVAIEGAIGLAIYEGLLGENRAGVLRLGVQVLIGMLGNDMRRWQLKKRGFITADIVSGDSDLVAEQRFFDRWLRQPSATTGKPTSV